MAKLLSRVHDFLTSRVTSRSKATGLQRTKSLRTNRRGRKSESVRTNASPRRSDSLRAGALNRSGQASPGKRNTPYKKKQRTKAQAWYARRFTPGFVGSTFVNANQTSFGQSVINPTGGGLLIWPSSIEYHVTMFHDEKPARNNGFGFHVTDDDDGYHYYYDRNGRWLETTKPMPVGKRKRSFTIDRATNHTMNTNMHVPEKVATIARAFAAMQVTYRR